MEAASDDSMDGILHDDLQALDHVVAIMSRDALEESWSVLIAPLSVPSLR